MVVDISNVRHVGAELVDHLPNATARVRRIDHMSRVLSLLPPAQLFLEVDAAG